MADGFVGVQGGVLLCCMRHQEAPLAAGVGLMAKRGGIQSGGLPPGRVEPALGARGEDDWLWGWGGRDGRATPPPRAETRGEG